MEVLPNGFFSHAKANQSSRRIGTPTDLESAIVLQYGVHVGIGLGPDELQSLTEHSVAESHGRVDDVLAITTDDDESAVGVVGQRLGIDLAGSRLLVHQRETRSILSKEASHQSEE